MNFRIRLVGYLFVFFMVLVVIRLFYWQVLRGKAFSSGLNRNGYNHEDALSVGRGSILADDNSFLAVTVNGWLVYAYLPELEDDLAKIASILSSEFVNEETGSIDYKNKLQSEKERLFKLLSRKDVKWVALKNRVNDDKKKRIESLGIKGIGFQAEDMRFYPESSSAAHLLGFVGKDDKGRDRGYFGIEGYYNLILSGEKSYGRKDSSLGFSLNFGKDKNIPLSGQVDVLTNINKGLQILVEKKLADGIHKYGAKGGSAIIIEPKTGSIKVSASFPSYDPSLYFNFGDEFFKDPVISYSFEPGSVFKVIVMASALDAGVVSPDTRCDICDGPLRVDKYYINTWNNKYYPGSTMTEVIVNSDNVGMSFVAKRLGRDRLYEYLKKFGFGRLTGVDLEGEITPPLRDKSKWSEVDLVTASFGQGIAVTPIQLVRAVSAIANGGILVKPRVGRGVITNGLSKQIDPDIEGRVISEKAASEITSMMVEAAQSGESKWTHLRGFKVAGKTGTAQIPIAGHYDPEKTIASFVGFAPYDDPRFVMLVTLIEPTTSPWASETAAPLWYSIARDLFIYYKINPDI